MNSDKSEPRSSLCAFRTIPIVVLLFILGSVTSRAGSWTLRGSDKIGVSLKGITYGPSGFVAVGASGTIARSASGTNWTVTQLPIGDGLFGVCYGAGRYVAVGGNYGTNNRVSGVIWASPDGSNWGRVVENGCNAYSSVRYEIDHFTTASGCTGIYTAAINVSTNGTNWTEQKLPYPATYPPSGVIKVEDRFLYADYYNGLYGSMDRTNWTKISPGLTNTIGITARGSNVVALTVDGTFMYSVDRGQSWQASTQNIKASFSQLTAGPELFMAIGPQGQIATSIDGRVWEAQNSGTTDYLLQAAYGGGLWIVLGYSGTILTSPNGRDWVAVSSPTPQFKEVAFGAGKFVAVGSQTIMVSDDAVKWNLIVGSGASGVIYTNGIFVAVGKDILVSEDGLSWTAVFRPKWSLTKVAYGGGRFVAVGGVDALNVAESVAYQSTDGTNWSRIALNSIGNLDSLAYVDGVFVASSSVYGRTLQTSVVIGQGSPPLLQYPYFPNSLASGHAGLLTLSDGRVTIDGKVSPQHLYPAGNGAAYAGGHYFALGGRIWISEDGLAWRDLSPPTDRIFRAAAVGKGKLVVVGDGSILERELADGLLDSPTLTSSRSGSSIRLTWSSKIGHHYHLESSTALSTWEPNKDPSGGQPITWSGTGDRLAWEGNPQTSATLYRLRITAE